MIFQKGYEAPKGKNLMDTLKRPQQTSLGCFMLAPTVVQLHPRHSQEGERAANPGRAAALRCGQSGASRGHRSPKPGHGQEK